MSDILSKDGLRYIIARVLDNANDAIQEAAQSPDDQFVQGKRLAYYEILDTIRNELIVRDADLKDMLLELDPMQTT